MFQYMEKFYAINCGKLGFRFLEYRALLLMVDGSSLMILKKANQDQLVPG